MVADSGLADGGHVRHILVLSVQDLDQLRVVSADLLGFPVRFHAVDG
jgi:hypothetical protein